MFKFFKVISSDSLHFESTVTPAVNKLKGVTLELDRYMDEKVYDVTRGGTDASLGYNGGPENVHYLVMLPKEVIKSELDKLMSIDHSIWLGVKDAKRRNFSMLK